MNIDRILMGLPYISAHPTGSNFTCDPPVENTDRDIVVLIPRHHSCCHEPSYRPHSPDCWTHLRTKALALPNDTTALDARLAQERKEIANTCDRFHERGMTPAECAAHIRSMT